MNILVIESVLMPSGTRGPGDGWIHRQNRNVDILSAPQYNFASFLWSAAIVVYKNPAAFDFAAAGLTVPTDTTGRVPLTRNYTDLYIAPGTMVQFLDYDNQTVFEVRFYGNSDQYELAYVDASHA
jgi:hypothetical protein